MDAVVGNCEICQRPLAEGYAGHVCPMCRQEFSDLRAKAEEPKLAASSQITQSVEPAVPTARAEASARPHADHRQVERELQGLASLMRTSGTVWICVGIVQMILILLVHSPYNEVTFWMLALGAWNIGVGMIRLNDAPLVLKRDPSIVARYDGALGLFVVFLVINLIFGAVIGIAGAICDLVVRHRILYLRDWFAAGPTASTSRKAQASPLGVGVLALLLGCAALLVSLPADTADAIAQPQQLPAGPKYRIGQHLHTRLANKFSLDGEMSSRVPAASDVDSFLKMMNSYAANDRAGLLQNFRWGPNMRGIMTFEPGTEVLVLKVFDFDPITGGPSEHAYEVRIGKSYGTYLIHEASLQP